MDRIEFTNQPVTLYSNGEPLVQAEQLTKERLKEVIEILVPKGSLQTALELDLMLLEMEAKHGKMDGVRLEDWLV